MKKEDLLQKIIECKTISELDDLREDMVQVMMLGGKYQEVQKVFKKQKNKLLRITREKRNS